MKRRYKDRFVGRLNKNIKDLQKARKLKRYGIIKSEVEVVNGELTNSYVNSLSKALCMTLTLDEDSEDESEKLEYEIPELFDRSSLEKVIKQIFGF